MSLKKGARREVNSHSTEGSEKGKEGEREEAWKNL